MLSQSMPPRRLLGILGGMGTWATLDFTRQLASLRSGRTDQSHISYLLLNDTSIPDRSSALLEERSLTPLPFLIDGLQRLENGGATTIVIVCNTAHYWFPDFVNSVSVPIVHIADAAVRMLKRDYPNGEVLLLSTTATKNAGFYQDRLSKAGYSQIKELDSNASLLIDMAINNVKKGRFRKAQAIISKCLNGHDPSCPILLACTELPLALSETLRRRFSFVDCNRALAEFVAAQN